MSDAQDNGQFLPATANQALALNPNFGIFIGDLEFNGATTSRMNIETSALGSLYQLMLFVRGNHDNVRSGSKSLWENYFILANRLLPPGVTNYTPMNSDSIYLNYSFDYGNSRFIGLDVPGPVALLTSSELTFLDNRLTDAENSGLIHAFIYFHGPPYCITGNDCACYKRTKVTCTPAAFISVINKHPIVDAIFNGHEHVLAWTHMDNSRIAKLTNPYEQFITAPAGGESMSEYLLSQRYDLAIYTNKKAFGSVTVNGAAYTVSFYKVGTTTPIWSRTFSKTPYGPQVTINQDASQIDPTNLTPIIFDVAFSAPVTSFNSAGVTISGTAKGYKTVVIAGSGENYTLSVSGIASSGTVIASINPGAAQDSNGGPSKPSTSTDNTVTYNMPPTPGSPILTSLTMLPARGALITNLIPTFKWGASNPGASYYRIQVSTTTSFTTTSIDQTNIPTTSYTSSISLAPGLRYFWRVQGINIAGMAGPWTYSPYFQTPLGTPMLLYPGANETLQTNRPDFDWQTVVGATLYNIQIASTSNFRSILFNNAITSSEFSPTIDLPRKTLLYWRVRAETAFVSSLWSDVSTFTTGSPPSVPSLSKPANKSVTSDDTPLFQWSNSTTPTGVVFDHNWIQIATDSAFNSLVIGNNDNDVTTPTYTPTSDLASNTLFYWRVRSFSTTGDYSAWSTVFSFSTSIAQSGESQPK